MANTNRDKSFKELPISIDNVRKKILRMANRAENEVKGFSNIYSENLKGNTKWTMAIEKMCSQMGRTPDDLRDFDDLETALVKVRVNQEMPLSDYNELRRMLERMQLFDHIAYQLCMDLVNTYEKQLEKFCISFHQETKRKDLQSVKEYEMTIAECRQKIVENFLHVENNLEVVEEIRRKSVMNYIENYHKVLDKMEEACGAVTNVCHLFRRWVAADTEYPLNIQEEINYNSSQLLQLKDLVKELKEEQDGDGKKLRRTTDNLTKTKKQLISVRGEVEHYRQRHRNIQDNRDNFKATLRRKLEEREQIKEKLKEPGIKPSQSHRLSIQSEELQTEIRTIETKMRQMELQMESMKIEEEKVMEVLEKVSGQVKSGRRKHEAVHEQIRDNDESFKAINDDIVQYEAKIEALRKIKDVKLQTDTLKQIHYHGYNPEQVSGIKDQMQEAFQITSEEIGKDWMDLYQRLPFDPPRDIQQRQRDLEVIDISNRRLDVGFKLLAIKSLEKWRRLNTKASVDELVVTLRKIHKDKTAARIRRLVSTTPRSPMATAR